MVEGGSESWGSLIKLKIIPSNSSEILKIVVGWKIPRRNNKSLDLAIETSNMPMMLFPRSESFPAPAFSPLLSLKTELACNPGSPSGSDPTSNLLSCENSFKISPLWLSIKSSISKLESFNWRLRKTREEILVVE